MYVVIYSSFNSLKYICIINIVIYYVLDILAIVSDACAKFKFKFKLHSSCYYIWPQIREKLWANYTCLIW